jgi:putative DNA primase/helicase
MKNEERIHGFDPDPDADMPMHELARRERAKGGGKKGSGKQPSAAPPSHERSKAVNDARVEPSDRPTIKISTAIKDMADEAIEALCDDRGIYQRNHGLVQVLAVTAEEYEARPSWCRIAIGTPTIRSLPLPQLRSKLSHLARWQRFDVRSRQMVNARPDDDALQDVATRGIWPGIRSLEAVIEAPSLRPDGSVLDVPGYDPATRCLYIPSEAFPPIPDRPTKDDAVAALQAFEDLFADFPHKDQNHRATAIAAVLTALARTAIAGGVPAFVYDAAVKGSGKGLQAAAAAIIATSREVATSQFPHGDVEELRKVLFTFVREGVPIISFDNLPFQVAFTGAALEDALTSASIRGRILGKSESGGVYPFRSLVFVTGNNVNIAGDMPRRCVVSRVETPLEKPAERPASDYKHPERAGSDRFKRWVREHRAELVVKGLTLLRAYIVAGMPDQQIGVMESFGDWAHLICGAIVWAGGGNPLLTRPGSDGLDQEAAPLAVIVEELPKLAPDGRGITTSALIAELYKQDFLRGQEIHNHDAWVALREAIEILAPRKPGFAPSAKTLGEQLRGLLGRVVAGRKITAKSAMGCVKRWVVVESASGRPVML